MVEIAHQAVMHNQGQVCAAPSRAFVHKDIYDEFVRKSVERAKKRTAGNPFENNENGAQVNIHSVNALPIPTQFAYSTKQGLGTVKGTT